MKCLLLAFAILVAALGVEGQTAPQVMFRANVTDEYGRSISGLTPENFRVREDGVERKIVSVKIDDAPASVTIMIDVSGSITPKLRQSIIRSVWKLITAANPENEYSVFAFGENVYPVFNWNTPRETMKSKLEELGNMKLGSQNTGFFDCVLSGLKEAGTGNRGRKVLVIYSDGEDNQSGARLSQAKSSVKRSDLVIYCVGVNDSRQLGATEYLSGKASLDEIAAAGGGRSYYPFTDLESMEIGLRIADNLKNQYKIEWETEMPARDSKWRDVKVNAAFNDEKGRKKSLRVSTREGYYPDQVGLGK